MRVLVTASRTWTDRERIHQVLEALAMLAFSKGEGLTIVHGGARGGDSIADNWAVWKMRLGWPLDVERHPAQWARLGKGAGRLRNVEMVRAGADVCVAFIRDGSKGATHCAYLARKSGIRTVIFEWHGPAYTVDSLIRSMVTEMA